MRARDEQLSGHPSTSGTKWPLDVAWSERLRDAIIGAACRLLGVLCWPLTRPPRGGWPTPRRILVLKPCCMGDVLFTTPLLAAIKAAYPGSHLTVATGAWSAPVLAGNPHVDAILDVPSRIGLRDLRQWARRHARGGVRPRTRAGSVAGLWSARRAGGHPAPRRAWIAAGAASSIPTACPSDRTIIRCMRRTCTGGSARRLARRPSRGRGRSIARPPMRSHASRR